MNRTSPVSRWLGHAAFLLALIVVIARVTTADALRDPWDAAPGSGPNPHGPGPATALVLDLLMAVPALLVLSRRAIDRDARLRFRWSYIPMFLLAVWAVASVGWSADKFAAAVTSAHLLASACLLWAMSQLVHSWARLRLVAAVTFGLLVLLFAQSLMYKYIDVAANLEYWNKNKTDILKQHGWAPDSFPARQFEHKVTSGETGGFFTSPNTLAAVSVLLFAACIGIGVQKLLDHDDPMWCILPAVAAIALVWLLVQASSKTAGATPFVGISIIAIFAAFQKQIRRRSAAAYTAAVGVVCLCLLSVIAYGRAHHGLFAGHFSNSLDFRWKYWVASIGVFSAHPLVGVGWSNFGLYYLAHRLPEAVEEIKDPHNFLVRFFVELGMIGGILLIAWLLRLGWEVTRPSTELDSADAEESDEDSITIASPAIVVVVGMLISTIASTDFNQEALDTMALLLRPILLFLALLLGTLAASMRSAHTWPLDTRRAPWIFYCMLVGLGLFLLHNLIDFSWFETGPMAMFMLLLGSVLGMAASKESVDVKSPGRIFPIVISSVAAAIWIATAVFFVGPIVLGENSAVAANDSIGSAPKVQSIESAEHFQKAGVLLASAASEVPYDAEYPFRRALAALDAGDLTTAESLVQRATQMNPLYIDAYLLDANMQLKAEKSPDARRVISDFETILRLNPNDVSIHVQYAEALDRFEQPAAAMLQYQLALQADAALPIGEPRHLSSEQLADVQDHLRRDANRP